uniref:Uncharacterized protein n=1 Tax=Megaselia scalaris TaxID=36166 RepID=T1GMM4_MEGSC
MFKLFVFALFGVLAIVSATPSPKPKPGVLAYSAPLVASGAALYSSPYLSSDYFLNYVPQEKQHLIIEKLLFEALQILPTSYEK